MPEPKLLSAEELLARASRWTRPAGRVTRACYKRFYPLTDKLTGQGWRVRDIVRQLVDDKLIKASERSATESALYRYTRKKSGPTA